MFPVPVPPSWASAAPAALSTKLAAPNAIVQDLCKSIINRPNRLGGGLAGQLLYHARPRQRPPTAQGAAHRGAAVTGGTIVAKYDEDWVQQAARALGYRLEPSRGAELAADLDKAAEVLDRAGRRLVLEDEPARFERLLQQAAGQEEPSR